MSGTIRRSLVAIATLAALVTTPLAAQSQPSTDSSEYLYDRTVEKVLDCGVVQTMLWRPLMNSETDLETLHYSSMVTWFEMANVLKGSDLSNDEINAAGDRVKERLGGEIEREGLIELAKTCTILAMHNSDALDDADYRSIAERMEEELPDLVSASAARKLQTGGDYAPEPEKELVFGKWLFSGKGRGCRAGYVFDDGASFILNFNTFRDGHMIFEWDQLDPLPEDHEAFATAYDAHQQGIGTSEEPGFDYDSFPGSAVFADGKLVAGLGQISQGTRYIFGQTVQFAYFTDIVGAKVITIKILGEETHRIEMDDARLWNEMSNCSAQYPFG